VIDLCFGIVLSHTVQHTVVSLVDRRPIVTLNLQYAFQRDVLCFGRRPLDEVGEAIRMV
jgi:hypothetical protein